MQFNVFCGEIHTTTFGIDNRVQCFSMVKWKTMSISEGVVIWILTGHLIHFHSQTQKLFCYLRMFKNWRHKYWLLLLLVIILTYLYLIYSDTYVYHIVHIVSVNNHTDDTLGEPSFDIPLIYYLNDTSYNYQDIINFYLQILSKQNYDSFNDDILIKFNTTDSSFLFHKFSHEYLDQIVDKKSLLAIGDSITRWLFGIAYIDWTAFLTHCTKKHKDSHSKITMFNVVSIDLQPNGIDGIT